MMSNVFLVIFLVLTLQLSGEDLDILEFGQEVNNV